MTNGAFSILSYVDTSKLTDAERAELEGLQVEINETVARIQAAHAAFLREPMAEAYKSPGCMVLGCERVDAHIHNLTAMMVKL